MRDSITSQFDIEDSEPAHYASRNDATAFAFYIFCGALAVYLTVTAIELWASGAVASGNSRFQAVVVYGALVVALIAGNFLAILSGMRGSTLATVRSLMLFGLSTVAIFAGFYNLGWDTHAMVAAMFSSSLTCLVHSARLANYSLLWFVAWAVIGVSQRQGFLGSFNDLGNFPLSATWSIVAAILLPCTCAAITNVITDRFFSAYQRSREQMVAAANALRKQADTDPLTGFFNRNRLESEFEALRAQWDEDHYFVIALLDIDNFKAVNTSAGHEAGDAVLRNLAKRMLGAMPDASVIRLGGDEFFLMSVVPRDSEQITETLSQISRAASTLYRTEKIWSSASIGYTLLENACESLSKVTAEADMAMRQAKREGKGRIVRYVAGSSVPSAAHDSVPASFNPFMTTKEIRQAIPARTVGAAIQSGEIDFAFQPIYDCSNDTVVGAEALLRWQLSDGSLVPLEHYLATFVALEFQSPYFRIISEKRMSLLKRIRSARPIDVHFNFSMRSLMGLAGSSDVNDLVSNFAGSLEGLVIEICEQNFGDRDALRELTLFPNGEWATQAGAKLALDDFGKGENNLDRLGAFPIDIVKLDHSWVSQLTESRTHYVLVKRTGQICDDLGITVIAEGVESQEQESALMDLGIVLQQGFLRGKPVTAESLIHAL